jgi:TolA-binding protein
MRQQPAYDYDNRDSEQVYGYMEAQIDALKGRIQQLEAEKQTLRSTMLITDDQKTRKVDLQNMLNYIAAGRSSR